MTTHLLNAELLKRACGADPQACVCSLGACSSWESFTEDRWPNDRMRQVGTLRDPLIDEPTLEEFHPDGTRYGSANAPVAVASFPYNRCDAYVCGTCCRTLLRYTEFGGYYVDHRVREIQPGLIRD
ncbi:MAG: hypothetical protein JWR68_2750 [Polaromonas sp.]|nr:hypothetical protein [Polaromonas sp.]